MSVINNLIDSLLQSIKSKIREGKDFSFEFLMIIILLGLKSYNLSLEILRNKVEWYKREIENCGNDIECVRKVISQLKKDLI